MRQIIIENEKDLEELRKILIGNKIIQVQVKCLPNNYSLTALDLSNFTGQLQMKFLAQETPRIVTIKTCNAPSCVNCLLPSVSVVHLKYTGFALSAVLSPYSVCFKDTV